MLIVLVGLVKIPLVGFMLWLPFRSDAALLPATEGPSSSEDDGGRKTLPVQPHGRHPRRPRPQRPRRGPHGGGTPAPPRVRHRRRSPVRSARHA